jgi:hypothetical protein
MSPRPTENLLSAIVCPLTPRELPAALKNLAFWATAMPPLLGDQAAEQSRPKLIFSFNGAPDESLSIPLADAFDESPVLKASFETIEVRFCGLAPEKDLYIREGDALYAPFGRKAGPNWLFFETMRALRNEAKFVFLMETDCQPIIPDWIGQIQRACVQNQDAWIVGSHYCGVSPLHWSIARHINGNALYHIGDARFWDFLENRFWPWLNDHIASSMPNLAYDCGWETYLNRVEMEHAGSYEWVRVRDILQRFRLSNFVVNIAGAAELAGEYVWTQEEILGRFPAAAIVHGPLANSLEHRRGHLALGRIRLEGPASLDDKGLKVEGDLDSALFQRTLWIPDQPLEEGWEVAVSYAMDCPRDAGLIVRLHEPGGALMGSKKKLGVGAPRRGGCLLAITTTVPYVRLALGFLGPPGARINLSDLKCAVRRDGEPFGQVDQLLTH